MHHAGPGAPDRCAAIAEATAIPVGASGSTEVGIFRPRGAMADLPLLFFLADGGPTGSRPTDYGGFASELAEAAGVVVVVMAHDAGGPFPARNRLARSVLDHILANPEDFRIDPVRVAVGGDGFGGNLAAVLALPETDRPRSEFRLQVLICPVLSEMRTNGHDDGPGSADKASFLAETNRIFPDRALRRTPDAFPRLAGPEGLRALPPALMITAENDPARDDAEVYAAAVRDAGVDVVSLMLGAARAGFIADPDGAPAIRRAALSIMIASLRDALAVRMPAG